jgi:type III secretion system low calcium response chaperone LcrH/SycD
MTAPSLAGLIDQQIEKLNPNSSKEERAALAKVVAAALEKGSSIADAMKLPKDQLEFIYSYAIDLYEARKYEDASKSFLYLFYVQPKDPRFVFGYAASLHKLNQYEKAVHHYLLATAGDPTNPTAWFHGADCYVNLGNVAAADAMLTRGIEIAAEQSQYQQLKQGALALKEVIAEYTQRGAAPQS